MKTQKHRFLYIKQLLEAAFLIITLNVFVVQAAQAVDCNGTLKKTDSCSVRHIYL